MRSIFIIFRFIIIIALTAIFACDKKSPTETDYKYDGNWSGTTSQSEPISFTVENDEITYFAIKITHAAGSIEGDERGKLGTVNGDTFTVTLYWGKTIKINCTFNSTTSCTGTYSLNTGSGSWSTNKN